jgi:DNA-binding winged helix-turn-helix (wHTH) protein/alpha-beta hydrolase superfamily lysophospholipase
MIYQFADCQLDARAHVLMRDGQEVHCEPQVFDLLVLLATRAPELVSYDDMIRDIWNGRIVSDSTLAARVAAARAAVGDDGKRQAVIRTVPRRGVQLAVPVAIGTNEARHAAPAGPAVRQVIRYTSSRDGTGIAWAEMGAGPPLLRAGHWLSHLEHDLHSPVWRPLLDRQSARRRLVRYDPRGTGLSDRDVDFSRVSVEELADDLEAVADAAGLDRFPIYAISQSVPVAVTFAARHPDRVSRMILNNGLVQGSTARGEPEKTETMVAMIRSGWGVPDSPFMRAVATVFAPRSTPEELESLVHTQTVSSTPEVAAEIRRVVGEIDVLDKLDRITCPVLIMHCSGDAVQSPDQSKLMARRLKDAEFQSWDSTNHMVVPSDPIWDAAVTEFDRFLSEGE